MITYRQMYDEILAHAPEKLDDPVRFSLRRPDLPDSFLVQSDGLELLSVSGEINAAIIVIAGSQNNILKITKRNSNGQV